MEEGLLVRKIKEGVVIDHIPAGVGHHLLKLIDGITKHTFVVVANVKSNKMGKKDIIKVEKWFPDKDKLKIISLLAPTSTVNIIKDGEVVEKYKLSLPERIDGIFKCPNPRCITNDEREASFIATAFIKMDYDGTYHCFYCDTLITRDEFKSLKII